MTHPSDDRDSSFGWLGSWKLHAVILVFFTVSLVGPLRSSAPLVAVCFPGAFIAMSGWSVIRYFRMWSPLTQPVRTNAPVALYLVAATTTLFVAHGMTGRDVYRTAALGSLWLTIPIAVGAAFIIAFRAKIRDHAAGVAD